MNEPEITLKSLLVNQRRDTPDSVHIERFWSKVDKSGECWEWNGGKDQDGYGVFSVIGERVLAHRFSFIISNGKIIRGMLVCHTCDNPSCVRPSHLFQGTDLENLADRDAKNRVARGSRHRTVTHPEVTPRGDRHWNSKLTPEKVQEIRHKYKTLKIKHRIIAAEYGVDGTTIYDIAKGRSWRCLPC